MPAGSAERASAYLATGLHHKMAAYSLWQGRRAGAGARSSRGHDVGHQLLRLAPLAARPHNGGIAVAVLVARQRRVGPARAVCRAGGAGRGSRRGGLERMQAHSPPARNCSTALVSHGQGPRRSSAIGACLPGQPSSSRPTLAGSPRCTRCAGCGTATHRMRSACPAGPWHPGPPCRRWTG